MKNQIISVLGYVAASTVLLLIASLAVWGIVSVWEAIL